MKKSSYKTLKMYINLFFLLNLFNGLCSAPNHSDLSGVALAKTEGLYDRISPCVNRSEGYFAVPI